MARPAVAPAVEDVYRRVEEFRRDADAPLDWPLLRFVRLVGDQLGDLATLVDRIDYRTAAEGGVAGDTSDLVDPATADEAWLPWLAQAVGTRVGALTPAALRDAIAGAVAGARAATKPAVAAAGASALTGRRIVSVRDHQAGGAAGGEYDLTVYSMAGETPSPQAVLDAVTAARATPAGARVWHSFGGATWAQIETAYPTWTARNGKTWAALNLDAIPL